MSKLSTMALAIAQVALGASLARAEWIDATLTAYGYRCPHCTGKKRPDGIGANGKPAIPGYTIAADKRIPFGTKVYIDGQWWEVGDRGGKVKGKVFDLCLPTHKDAKAFGKQKAKIYIQR